ncbi:putative NADH dehydrogenase-like complex, subunit S [Helianthus debilis subsp. tardiflorus]
MANSFNLPTLHLHKSHFLNHTQFTNLHPKPPSSFPTPKHHHITTPHAKFNLYEILGGRGLCNGEEGLQQELKKPPPDQQQPPPPPEQPPSSTTGQEDPATFTVPEDGFEKELLGLTGGFPGGEKGLKDFIEKYPPPKKTSSSSSSLTTNESLTRKAKAPELPLLMPGMIAIVKNPNSPYHMYCGIVQRITDGKAGVLFEGGNWDRLITFKLNELERREKGPPMVSPRSVVLEEQMKNSG